MRYSSQRNDALVLAGLIGLLAWLTLTGSGKTFARQIGGKIMELSSAGLDFIAGIEGFSPTAYNDPPGSGKWSIGYGHQIKPGDGLSVNSVITRDTARELLRQDTLIAGQAVARNIHVPLTQEQHDALVSFVFNIGETAFRNGTVPSKINAGNFIAAANTMLLYNKAGGVISNALIARREKEAGAFA